MTDLQQHVDRAKDSLYFSGARIDAHVEAFLRDHGAACRAAGAHAREAGTRHVFLVGSGGSYASMLTAKYVLDRLVDLPIDVVASYELLWRAPRRVGDGALVVLASYSGETEDTVAAMRRAREAGARTFSLVGRPDSTMARESDSAVVYDTGAIYEVPIMAAILIAAELTAGGPAAAEATALAAALDGLPDVLRRALDGEEQRAEAVARDILKVQHLYVLGAGPLSSLAYKVALSVVMENVRIGATYCDAVEWRHGPAEAMERTRPSMWVLLGTDESRAMTERTIAFCRDQGADVLVYDAAAYGELHPLLTPLVMNSHTQWLIVWSAIRRGITDLDERVFMGHNVLATGGAQWP